jgi:cytochrome c-type biogenesis protein CcmH/NrfG
MGEANYKLKRRKTEDRLLLLIVFLFGTLLYAQSVTFDYALDDKLVITHNDFTQEGIGGIPKLFSTGFLVGFYGEQRNLLAGGRYRPLSLVTFAVEWEVFGRRPGLSHLVNALLYGLTGVVLLVVLRRLLPKVKSPILLSVPLVATAIFLAHPLHSEVVANIKSRDEILSFLGALVTLYFTLRFLEKGKLSDQAVVFAVFFLSLLAKESVFTFLAVIPLSVYFFTSHPARRTLLSMIPLAAAGVLWLGIRYAAIGSAQLDPAPELMNDPFVNASGGERLATVFYTMGLYLKLLFFPHPLTHDYYPHHIPIISWTDVRALVSLLIYTGLGTAVVWGFRRKSAVAYAVLIYLVTFFPFSNLVFSIGTFMNERFMYVPSLGFSIVAALFLTKAVPRFLKSGRSRVVVGGLVVTIVALYSVMTVTRARAWQDDYTLFTTDVRTSSNSAKANMSAGLALVQRTADLEDLEAKRPLVESAVRYLNRSIELYPAYLQPMDVLGSAYFQIEDYEAALDAFSRCLEAGGARSTTVGCTANLERLADACAVGGAPAVAVRGYAKLLEYDPTNAILHSRLGTVYGRDLGDTEASLRHLRRAQELDPDNPDILRDLGVAYGVSGDTEKAIQTWVGALELNPRDTAVLMNLSVAYRSLGDMERANEYRSRALAQDPSSNR